MYSSFRQIFLNIFFFLLFQSAICTNIYILIVQSIFSFNVSTQYTSVRSLNVHEMHNNIIIRNHK